MNAKEYLRARLDLLAQVSPEEFQRVLNYSNAAMRACESDKVHATWETIMANHEFALRLASMYPEGMPLTFAQLAELQERDPSFKNPPPGAMAGWWSGL